MVGASGERPTRFLYNAQDGARVVLVLVNPSLLEREGEGIGVGGDVGGCSERKSTENAPYALGKPLINKGAGHGGEEGG